MGHFSHNCKLTNLPIRGGDSAVLIVMKPSGMLYDNSDDNLIKHGSTYMCSNETTRMKYVPCWFPIKGKYDDYGGMEEIVEDDNTKIIEEYYGLTIQEIVNVITSNRKDDGYDDCLKVIKAPIVNPYEYLEDEDHFHYYQRVQNDPMPFGDNMYPDVRNSGDKPWTVIRDGKRVSATKEEYDTDFKLIHEQYARYKEWCKENPDVNDDYGKPVYQEKYKGLVTLSGMWVRGEVYDKLTENAVIDIYGDRLDFGRPEVLEAIGFERNPDNDKDGKERFRLAYTKGNLTVYSDGNWLGGSVYCWDEFEKLAKNAGETIDFKEIASKDKMEQIFDYVIPKFRTYEKKPPKITETPEEELKGFEELKKMLGDKLVLTLEKYRELSNSDIEYSYSSREDSEIIYYFLNTGWYSSTRILNPMTTEYIKAAKEGKLRDNLVKFWRFDRYMYSCGKYYEIVSTGPQDGDYESVAFVLSTALDIANEELKGDRDENEE